MAPKSNKATEDTSSRLAAALNDSSVGQLIKGSRVWVKHEDPQNGVRWLPGELRALVGATHSTAEVMLEDGSGNVGTFELARLVPANPKLQQGIPDLTHLSYLNEPGILYNLKHRYGDGGIYTFAGPVLIALNPCKSLPLYTSEMANAYKAGARDAVGSTHLAPHIYLVAAAAFRKMLREHTSQSLIVNGESGAGKTETTKKAMQYFATLAGGTGVEDQVLETNPILEAFGNAKTLRNHNSSRFGKLIQIHFNQSHHICGACIKTYLLEKSRVVHQLSGERSFHIFYQLVRGASPALRKELWLPDHPTGFNFLAQSGCTDIDGVDDAEEFRNVCQALSEVGITLEAQAALWRLLGGVLWLGNLEFVENEADTTNDSTLLCNNEAVEPCCALLGVTPKQLHAALTTKRIVTPSEVITKLMNVEESRDARDALAKALYSAAFDWIVKAINIKLDTGKKSSGLSIAILDIYGFEQFTRNSFEQLCINYANERLQQQFTRHLFTLEQQEYESEGIDWTKVEFIDNQECVDVIEAVPPKGLGVLSVLDAQCRFPKATDETFLDTLKEALSGHPAFSTSARARQDFTILHYAGAVAYSSDGFLDKNKDTLNSDLVELMCVADASLSPLVPVLGAAIREDLDANARRGGQTVGSRFSQQLRELITQLDTTGLHFVRCIKPNAALKPDIFEEGMTLHQLRCCGVLEVARIARAGFPTRYTHQAFAERYAILLPQDQQAVLLATAHSGLTAAEIGENALSACRQLVDLFGLTPAQYQVGCTKIFFRPGVLGFVEDKWAAMQSGALRIQTAWRMHTCRSTYLRLRTSAIVVQSVFRAVSVRKAYLQLLREVHAATKIQAAWRRYSARTKYIRMRTCALVIQMAWRRSRFDKRVHHRVLEREKRELLAQIEQDKFQSLRSQYGCDMDEVRAALAAWQKVRQARSQGGDAEQQAMAVMAETLATKQSGSEPRRSGAGAGAASVGMMASAGASIEFADQGTPGPHARGSSALTSAGASLEVAGREMPTPGMTPVTGAGGRQWFAAAQEAKEQAEKLALENMRLTKQLALERSLKDRYQHKYEEQNALWLDQIRTLQDYIQQVRSAFGDARLPPLPHALATMPPPANKSDGGAMATRSSGGVIATRSSGGATPAAAGCQEAEFDTGLALAGGSPFAAAVGAAATAAADDAAPAPAAPPSVVPPVELAEQGVQCNLLPEVGAHAATAAAVASSVALVMHGSDDEDAMDDHQPSNRGPAHSAGSSQQTPSASPVHTTLPPHPSTPTRSGPLSSGQPGLQPSPSQIMPHPAHATPPARAMSPARTPAVTHQQPQQSQRSGAASKYVGQLQGELDKVSQVLADDVTFIAEVGAGVTDAPGMQPAHELAKLKKKFDIWRKEFKDKLRTAEDVLRKLERMQAANGHQVQRGEAMAQLTRIHARPAGSSGGGAAGQTPPPSSSGTTKKGFMGKLFSK